VEKLISEYRMLKADLDKTGNDVETAPSLPEYWEVMVECLGDRLGLSQLSLAESELEVVEEVELSDESESVPSSDKKRQLGSGKTKGKEKAIEVMASAMKEGMSELAEAMKVRAGGGALEKIEKVIDGLGEQARASTEVTEKLEKTLDGFADTQKQILSTLQALCNVLSKK